MSRGELPFGLGNEVNKKVQTEVFHDANVIEPVEWSGFLCVEAREVLVRKVRSFVRKVRAQP